MKTLFKCGDLVVYSNGYLNGVSIYWWCKVIDIIVNNQSHDQYEIITGRGDENTKAIFRLKPLGISKYDLWDFKYQIDSLDEEEFSTDQTHSIHLIDTQYFQKEYVKHIKKANDKMDFINKHRNRNEKIEDLIGDSL